MLLSAIHGFIVLQDVPQMQILNFGRLVCAECHRDIKQKAPEYIQRNQYSHVAGEYNPETDVEANNGPNRINLRDDQETSPMRQSSESTTETSRLFTAAEY